MFELEYQRLNSWNKHNAYKNRVSHIIKALIKGYLSQKRLLKKCIWDHKLLFYEGWSKSSRPFTENLFEKKQKDMQTIRVNIATFQHTVVTFPLDAFRPALLKFQETLLEEVRTSFIQERFYCPNDIFVILELLELPRVFLIRPAEES